MEVLDVELVVAIWLRFGITQLCKYYAINIESLNDYLGEIIIMRNWQSIVAVLNGYIRKVFLLSIRLQLQILVGNHSLYIRGWVSQILILFSTLTYY